MFAFIVCLCSPVQAAALGRADLPSESYRLSIRLRNWSETKRFTDAVFSREGNRNMNEWMNEGMTRPWCSFIADMNMFL
jgi:hypothetical protein